MIETKKNVVLEKSYTFALKIINIYKKLSVDSREFVLSKQLLRCGTSIGANVNEAAEAQSRADFIHKMSIALKEPRETQYWLKLLQDAKYISDSEDITQCNNELIYLLTSIIKKAKTNMKNMPK